MPSPVENDKQPTWGERWIVPMPFFLGSLLALLVCRQLGQIDASRNIFRNFSRFHQQIAPGSQFYPTASQVRALAVAHLKNDKIPVIIGGNSVLHGVGQTPGELWTRKLQELLGEKFAVINLAMRGARPTEFASIIAESLVRDYPDVIYVTNLDMPPQESPPDGVNTYRYLFWDAYYKGLIDLDGVRIKSIERYVRIAGEKNREQLTELRVRARLNSLLYFEDLWNAVEYEQASLLWLPLLSGRFAMPREQSTDCDMALPTHEQRYPEASVAPEMRIVRGRVAVSHPIDALAKTGACADPETIADPNVRESVSYFRDCMPDALESRTILVGVRESCYFTRRLNADEQVKYARSFKSAVAVAENLGYSALEVGEDWGDMDYADRCHLAVGGGAKLAEKLAPVILAKASHLESAAERTRR